MAQPIKVVVTNKTDGPKIFNGIMPALLHPGQETGPLEVSEAELRSMRSTGYFDIAGGEEVEPGPLDGSVGDLTTHLATVDDPAEIERLIQAETAGKSRKGALTALEARRDELAG